MRVEIRLENWNLWVIPAGDGRELVTVRLTGYVTDHPKLGEGRIHTSPVEKWEGRTVTTRNTTYVLGDFTGRNSHSEETAMADAMLGVSDDA